MSCNFSFVYALSTFLVGLGAEITFSSAAFCNDALFSRVGRVASQCLGLHSCSDSQRGPKESWDGYVSYKACPSLSAQY